MPHNRQRSTDTKASAGAGDKQRVVELAQANRLEEARALCAGLCRKHKRDAEAWFLLGAIHGHMKNYAEAAQCCRQVVKLTPDVAMGHYNLGIALHQTKDYAAAIRSFHETLRLQPDFAEAHHELGNALQAAGEPLKAIDSYRRTLQLRPALAAAHFNLGRACQAAGMHAEAGDAFRLAVQGNPALGEARLALAAVLMEQGLPDEAEQQLREVLRQQPANPQALGNLGNLLQQSAQYQQAADCYRRVLEQHPRLPEAHFNLANTLRALEADQDAIDSYLTVIELDPDFAAAYNNLGLIYKERGETAEAIRLFRRSLQADPLQADARINLSSALSENGQIAQAMEPLREVLNAHPEHSQAHADLSLLLLQSGNFAEGWREYQWRFHVHKFPARRFPAPDWQGESLEKRTILIHAEQGMGDELMFASCLPDIIRQAEHVIIDCDARLVPLFKRSFADATIHGGPQSNEQDWLASVPHFDVQSAAGSVPRYLRPDLESFPQHNGYLLADAHQLAEWQRRYAALGPGCKIGISWRGGHISKAKKRSTTLDQWCDVLQLPGVQFINLQYGECSAELAAAAQSTGIDIHSWEDADPLRNMDYFAAQIAALDLVISVDNSTVHMAGALGVPVWALQPEVADWRWLTDCDNSYWYPSLRQFRQQQAGAWEPVLQRVSAALRDWLAHRASPASA